MKEQMKEKMNGRMNGSISDYKKSIHSRFKLFNNIYIYIKLQNFTQVAIQNELIYHV